MTSEEIAELRQGIADDIRYNVGAYAFQNETDAWEASLDGVADAVEDIISRIDQKVASLEAEIERLEREVHESYCEIC